MALIPALVLGPIGTQYAALAQSAPQDARTASLAPPTMNIRPLHEVCEGVEELERFAYDDDAGTITVSGTRITRQNVETASPMAVVTEESLNRSSADA